MYSFGSAPPNLPITGLTLAPDGSLYGVLPNGGDAGAGVVYKLFRANGNWQFEEIYSFKGNGDGSYPTTEPVFGPSGNLYGATGMGGAYGFGTIYRLSPTTNGQWAESVLYSFTGGSDGGYGAGNLIFDDAGNLYGSNLKGANQQTVACQNTAGCGVVFQLSPTSTNGWKFQVLHTFSGGWDGVGPAWLSMSPKKQLFGAAAGAWTGSGLPNQPGLIFQLSEVTGNGPWKDIEVHGFSGGTDGALPSGVIFDGQGNMYGTAAGGGFENCSSASGPIGCGLVFELRPTSDGKWREIALYLFYGGSDGGVPSGGVIAYGGVLWGTTLSGGNNNGGVLYSVSNTYEANWTENVWHAFTGSDGLSPQGPLAWDKKGNLYGTTQSGGANGTGAAFVFNEF